MQELTAERGVVITYETDSRWGHTFGPAFAAGLRRRRPAPGDLQALWAASVADDGQVFRSRKGGTSPPQGPAPGRRGRETGGAAHREGRG